MGHFKYSNTSISLRVHSFDVGTFSKLKIFHIRENDIIHENHTPFLLFIFNDYFLSLLHY
jgi:hypothetical protein